jgi:glycosyltransferase involved in cell wall biosynthesis
MWLGLHLKYAEKIIAVSQSVVDQLPSSSSVCKIPNELPVEERYANFVKKEEEKNIFLYLSNFMKGKGQNYALQAFAKIHDRLPDWKLRFVGGDMGLKKNMEYRKGLLASANELGIFEKTEWIGFTENVELEYRSADIVLNFSESESFSITCVEASFFGRPVIVTDCGGPREIIVNEKTGVIVPNKDIETMALAMKRLADNDETRTQMGLKAREVVTSRFGVENTSLRLKSLYMDVLKSWK